jgi:AmiR/NasT family two-component response regulator
VVIEQAKGVICEHDDVDLAEAFARLRPTPAPVTCA